MLILGRQVHGRSLCVVTRTTLMLLPPLNGLLGMPIGPAL